MKPSKKGKERIQFILNKIKEGLEKKDIKEEYIKKYKCHASGFYDFWHMATRKTRPSHSLPRRKTPKGNCYFCNKNALYNHHIKYSTDEVISLCSSCHLKLHYIIKTQERLDDKEIDNNKAREMVNTNKIKKITEIITSSG